MGTLGYSIPAAIGAKFARPDRDVIVICGDGSFQMGLNELATIAGNQLGIKIIIMKNARLGMVRELQDKHYGDRHSATVLNGDPDFLKITDSYAIDYAETHSNKVLLILKNRSFLFAMFTPTLRQFNEVIKCSIHYQYLLKIRRAFFQRFRDFSLAEVLTSTHLQ